MNQKKESNSIKQHHVKLTAQMLIAVMEAIGIKEKDQLEFTKDFRALVVMFKRIKGYTS